MSTISKKTKENFRQTVVHYVRILSLKTVKRCFDEFRHNWIVGTVDDLSCVARCPACIRSTTHALLPGTYEAIGCKVRWDCDPGLESERSRNIMARGYLDLVIDWPQDKENESLMLMMSNELRGARGVSVSYPYLVLESKGGYRIAYSLWETDGGFANRDAHRHTLHPARWIASEICVPVPEPNLSPADSGFVNDTLVKVGGDMFAVDYAGDSIAHDLMTVFGRDRIGRSKMEHYQGFMAGLYLLEELLPFKEVSLFGSSAYYIFRAQSSDLNLHPDIDRRMPKDLDVSVLADDDVVDKERAFVDFVRIAQSIMKLAIRRDWMVLERRVVISHPQPHIFRTQMEIFNYDMGLLRFDLSMRFNLTGIPGEVPAPTPLIMRQCVSFRYDQDVPGFRTLKPIITLPVETVMCDSGNFMKECIPNEDTFYMVLGVPRACLYIQGETGSWNIPEEQHQLLCRIESEHGVLRTMWDDDIAEHNSSALAGSTTAGRNEEMSEAGTTFVELAGCGRSILPTSLPRSPHMCIDGWEDFRIVRLLKNQPRDGY